MEIALYCVAAAIFVFIIWRWETIDELIESRKPRYDYIEWLECKALEAPVSNLHSFWGLRPGPYDFLLVAGCRACKVPSYDGDEVFPCPEHVKLFND